MEYIIKSEEIQIMRDTDDFIKKCWSFDSYSIKEPEIWCIKGAYVNTAVIRKIACNEGIGVSSWDDPHGNQRGGDEHHNHSTHDHHDDKLQIKPADINIINELKEDYKFMLRPSLKFREERNGSIVALSLNGFFVNNTGSHFLKILRDNAIFSIDDIRKISKKLGISEDAGLKFLRKLLIFGLAGIVND